MIVQSSSSTRLRSGSVDQQQRKKPSASQQERTNNDYDELNCRFSSSELEISYQHSSTSFNRQKSVDSSGPYGRGHYGSDSNGSVDSGEELDYNSDDGGNNSADKKFELIEMDLYILSEKSPMYMHLKSTWNSFILQVIADHHRDIGCVGASSFYNLHNYLSENFGTVRKQ
ncbi:hypothetical protein AWC38_SpisGene23319 [Stylophora pistillata]|uniref:Uncharacterized protein n=1 Tax=Stylophora pistillata TaxID=50429 RepID=A0A2B4R4X6_STYPI|nr:hypothetical protein AWC38_SpisGene23319 [Stylophora pistillata]